jgi:hypothetical protein
VLKDQAVWWAEEEKPHAGERMEWSEYGHGEANGDPRAEMEGRYSSDSLCAAGVDQSGLFWLSLVGPRYGDYL